MVFTASFLNSHLTAVSSDAKRYFVLTYQAANFNDATIQITDGFSNPVFSAAQQLIHIEGVQFLFVAAAAGISGLGYVGTTKTPVVMAYYGPFTTTAVRQAIDWRPNITFGKAAIADNDVTNWLSAFQLAGYGAADDCTIIVWGWIDALELEPSPAQPVRFERPQTVSVEGVKLWSRR